jgi:hypothetical protein|tara:strand:- start:319 stop:1431 length:1113 start_codon:yes stop_codon:yes gene_type:complete
MANIELDGSNKKIIVDSGDLTLDIPGDIILDADGANVTFKDGGTSVLDLSNSSTDAVLTVSTQDKDLIIKGDDGGSAITAATFDMSDAGTLILNHDLVVADAGKVGSASATDAMTISSGGIVTFKDDILIKDGGTIGSASDADAIAIAANGVVTFSQNPVFPDGGVAVADLDIDGATDIGAAIVDADLFIIDDGAGGTNRKTTASRLKTYVGGGITGYDRFKLSSSFTGDSQPITSNLSRTAHGEFEKIGSGMSESSGVFTFPETGLWKIGFQAQFYGDANAYGRIQINWSTNSGTSYTSSGWADTSSWGQPNGNNGNYRTITAAILNVTNASTWRVTVEAEQQDDSDGSVYGAGSDVTFVEFTRLADSQ